MKGFGFLAKNVLTPTLISDLMFIDLEMHFHDVQGNLNVKNK